MASKFIVGRYLDLPAGGFNNNPTLVAAPGAPAHFAQVPSVQYEIMVSKGLITKRSEVAAGRNDVKTHRNFRWLPWIPGKVSYVPLAGDDVLTGPFTGCWVVIFDLGGTLCVGHIGTELSAENANSKQVKAAWTAALDTNAIRAVKAFNPVAGLPMKYDGAPTFYALITATQQMSSVVLTQDYKATGPAKQKIDLIVPATPVEKPPFA